MPLTRGEHGVDLEASFKALEDRIAAVESHPALTKADLVAAIQEPSAPADPAPVDNQEGSNAHEDSQPGAEG